MVDPYITQLITGVPRVKIGPNGGKGGRPLGATNLVRRDAKRELHQFFSSQEYQESVKRRILAGTAPTIELYFLQLLYGQAV